MSLCMTILSITLPGAAPATSPAAGRVVEAVRVVALQREPEDPQTGRYDWGPSVMKDGGLYRMWWVRLGGTNRKRFPYAGPLPDGERFEFTYPDWGDRIYYAESRDGVRWNISGEDYAGPGAEYGPDSRGPLRVLGPAESEHEKNHVGTPSVIRVDGTFYMYYEACAEYQLRRGPDGKPRIGNEYQNQVFVATSKDGRVWRKHPNDADPRPIIRAPEANKDFERQRYGLGQPSVFYRDGRFVMHYVDSCNGPGDFVIRIEADNPFFENARVFPRALRPAGGKQNIPDGAVARFAQTDIKYLNGTYYLVRPAYGTGNLNLLASRTGVFSADAGARRPRDEFPQVRIRDPRGDAYRARLTPDFLTGPDGRIVVEDGCIVIFFGSGRRSKTAAYTWDLYRCEVPLRELVPQ
jgi:hypothetical protein